MTGRTSRAGYLLVVGLVATAVVAGGSVLFFKLSVLALAAPPLVYLAVNRIPDEPTRQAARTGFGIGCITTIVVWVGLTALGIYAILSCQVQCP